MSSSFFEIQDMENIMIVYMRDAHLSKLLTLKYNSCNMLIAVTNQPNLTGVLVANAKPDWVIIDLIDLIDLWSYL